MSARSKIVNKLVTLTKGINGTSPYTSNLFSNVENKLKFWDEVNDYPYVCIVAGAEQREYLPSNFKWGFLNVTIRIYVKDEEPQARLEEILEDIELLLDSNNNFEYDTGKTVDDIRILNIDTDEGVLTPLGIGEILIQIRYDL